MQKQLKKKIDELFEYRRFPLLFKEGGSKYSGSELLALLVQLQADIYHLDHYLETNWKISDRALAKYWKTMNRSLLNVGVAKNQCTDYLSHIAKYQKHELSLRAGLFPDRFSLAYFYFYKSCDVKLLRRIMFDQLPGLLSKYPHADWRYFDLITEVNDDLEDILEDYDCINCNAYLISVFKIGIKETNKQFKVFISEIRSQNKLRFEKKGSAYAQIYKWTQEELKATEQLLKKNAEILADAKLMGEIHQAILYKSLGF